MRYDKTFVTSDKLAATLMYAYYRNVRFVYLYRDEHIKINADLFPDSTAGPLENVPSFMRYAFVLSRQ